MAVVVAVALGVPAPVDPIVQLGLDDLPGVAVGQPVVCRLHLPAVVDLLVEDAELVADAVADGGALKSGQRIQVAGGQPSQPTVAQAGFLLAGQHSVEILAQRGQRGAGLLLDLQVEQVAAQMRAHQELGRQIADHLLAEFEVGLGGVDPALLHAVANGQSEGVVVVLWLQ